MGLELIELVPIFMVFILYFLGMPIVYALFGSTFFYFTFIDTTSKNWLILQKVMTSTQSFSMLAIPFFVMAGSVMNYGGISDKMMDFAEVLTGHMKGGLAQVNVVLSMLMGGCSGSANADCAMQSKMLVPEMEVDGELIGSIGRGYMVLMGVSDTDTEEITDKMVDKMCKLRIFEDENGKTNCSLADVDGEILLISQFTLYADCSHGNRPGFTGAGNPELANHLYEHALARCAGQVRKVEHGIFGADMKVELLNDGPFTILLDSDTIVKKK